MIRLHALHDWRRYEYIHTVPRCWAPHTQTQMHGVQLVPIMIRPCEPKLQYEPTIRSDLRGARPLQGGKLLCLLSRPSQSQQPRHAPLR